MHHLVIRPDLGLVASLRPRDGGDEIAAQAALRVLAVDAAARLFALEQLDQLQRVGQYAAV